MTDTVFFDNMLALSKRMLDKFGFAGQITDNATTGGYIDDNGNYVADSSGTSFDCLITPTLQYKNSEVDGSAVQSGDCYVYIESTDEPLIDMVTIINGETWRIVDVMGITTPDGVVLYRKLQLRK